MQLIAWRTTISNPCNNPPVYITIASKEPGAHVDPWVLPLTRAVEMFGEAAVDQIQEEPIPVSLELLSPKIGRVARRADQG